MMKKKEIQKLLTYLNADEQKAIGGWLRILGPRIRRNPELANVDLVIEGGVGTGITLPSILRCLFPEALYVGTDIARTIMGYSVRYRERVDTETVQRIRMANERPTKKMEGAVIHVNCFDYSLVRDIAEKTGSKAPLLASYDAIPALLDKKMNPWERKAEDDRYSTAHIVSKESPYVGQLHVGIFSWRRNPQNSIEEAHHRLKNAAEKRGWRTDTSRFCLLLVNPQKINRGNR